MTKTKELKRLYEQYDSIQGDNPIPLGTLLSKRMEERHYKTPTVKQVVGLLQSFVDNYETASCPRNTKYAVRFRFDIHDPNINGPLLIILDAVKEECVEVLAWNKGKIAPLCGENKDSYKVQASRDYHSAIQEIRDHLKLSDTYTWSSLDDGLHQSKTDKSCTTANQQGPSWKEIGISPIVGLDAVTAKQIADKLCVSYRYVLICMREHCRNHKSELREMGVARANAKATITKIGVGNLTEDGALFPLECGDKITVPSGDSYYLSRS